MKSRTHTVSIMHQLHYCFPPLVIKCIEKPEKVFSLLLFQALQTALAEEDSLADQLDQETEEALASAIKEEENWRKELEREENDGVPDIEDNEADTEDNTEGDTEAESDTLGVSIT